MVLVSVTICCGTMYGQGRPDRGKRMTREQLSLIHTADFRKKYGLSDRAPADMSIRQTVRRLQKK